jgi:DNA-binding transcriptional ArsR family regulator
MRRTSTTDEVVLDAKGLRALAHPVRVQMLGLLRAHGPATATRLGERLGINSGAASYHLRQLGAAGFVEEDHDRGNARERWWRSVHQSTRFQDSDLVEREPETTVAFLQSLAAAYSVRTQRAINEFPAMSQPWRVALDMSDVSLRLTPDEANTLGQELNAVLARYRHDTPEETTGAPEDAERVSVISIILPELGTDERPMP